MFTVTMGKWNCSGVSSISILNCHVLERAVWLLKPVLDVLVSASGLPWVLKSKAEHNSFLNLLKCFSQFFPWIWISSTFLNSKNWEEWPSYSWEECPPTQILHHQNKATNSIKTRTKRTRNEKQYTSYFLEREQRITTIALLKWPFPFLPPPPPNPAGEINAILMR